MTRAAILLAILSVEAAIGYPQRWPHPVMAIGATIGRLERAWNRGSDTARRIGGVALLAVLIGGSVAIGLLVEEVAGQGAGLVLVVLVGTTALAQRSLDEHVVAVRDPLARGRLGEARGAVARIVGRDTQALDQGGVAIAAVESLAESFCDGVVAPACWFLVAGLPGLFAAKAINTADSMVGHRTEQLAAFGWASARADDLVNLLPARLAGALVCIAGGGGWRTMLADARRHASPNGGWPEAAMAGALRRRLGGAISYDGVPADRATLGTGPLPDACDLARALRIYRRACLLLWASVGALAWAR